MQLCTKTEYLAACRAYPHEWARIHEGAATNAVEWIDDSGRLLASALYTRALAVGVQSAERGLPASAEYRIAD